MPANITSDRLWKKAEEQAAKEGRAKDYAYINGIYQKMGGKFTHTSGSANKAVSQAAMELDALLKGETINQPSAADELEDLLKAGREHLQRKQQTITRKGKTYTTTVLVNPNKGHEGKEHGAQKPAHDEHAARELELYIENDAQLHRQQFEPIINNMKRKMENNTFDAALAPKLLGYLVDNGAKKYEKEFGSGGAKIFDVATRKHLAQKMAKDLEQAIRGGEYGELKIKEKKEAGQKMSPSELKQHYKEKGSHFFDKDTMKFHNSQLHSGSNEHGHFITSEQMPGSNREYKVRQHKPHTSGEGVNTETLSTHKTLEEAQTAHKEHAAKAQSANKAVDFEDMRLENLLKANREETPAQSELADLLQKKSPDDLAKARSHKYIRKENGRYIYADSKGKEKHKNSVEHEAELKKRFDSLHPYEKARVNAQVGMMGVGQRSEHMEKLHNAMRQFEPQFRPGDRVRDKELNRSGIVSHQSQYNELQGHSHKINWDNGDPRHYADESGLAPENKPVLKKGADAEVCTADSILAKIKDKIRNDGHGGKPDDMNDLMLDQLKDELLEVKKEDPDNQEKINAYTEAIESLQEDTGHSPLQKASAELNELLGQNNEPMTESEFKEFILEKGVAAHAFSRTPGPGLVPQQRPVHGKHGTHYRTIYVHPEGGAKEVHARPANKDNESHLTKKDPKNMTDKELWQALSSMKHERHEKNNAHLDSLASEYRRRRAQKLGKATEPYLNDPEIIQFVESSRSALAELLGL